MVGYVWAGIGGTFSIVILFTLFWKRYHGRAVIATIVSGLLFTVLWSVTRHERQDHLAPAHFFRGRRRGRHRHFRSAQKETEPSRFLTRRWPEPA